jgi:RNA ligase (TIGR02306 family)
MGVDTHKVEVVPIKLEPHPDPETTSLSIVKVYNFQVVVRTADWLGVEKAAYVQPDSVMPDTPEYRWLKDTGTTRTMRKTLEEQKAAGTITPEEYEQQSALIEERIDKNTKRLRVTVMKLRGVLSMGMLLPAPEGAEIGDDVAERLGITHYEPPIEEYLEPGKKPKHQGEDVAPPPSMIYAPEYDVESVYKYASAFEAGEMVVVTEKIDGQNARFVAMPRQPKTFIVAPDTIPVDEVMQLRAHIDECGPCGEGAAPAIDYESPVFKYEIHAGSRKEWKMELGGSNWWRVQKQVPWIVEWLYANPEKVLYGETYGWVAPLRYGATVPGTLYFRAFDILEGMEWMDAEKFITVLPETQRVPLLGVMPFDFEKLQKLAEGPSLVPGAKHMREGIVIKPVKERKHYRLGRVMVKMVSNKYLEEQGKR